MERNHSKFRASMPSTRDQGLTSLSLSPSIGNAGREDSSIRSINSSTASGTPSKVLADKFNSLDERWNQHKAQSPIKVIRTRRARIRKKIPVGNGNQTIRRPQISSGTKIEPVLPTRLATSKEDGQQQQKHDDDSSMGESTVSTLSSTESVFDRLYRQKIRSPRGPSSTGGRSSNLASTSVLRTKDRLGAYYNANTNHSDTRSLGPHGDKTPRRGPSSRHHQFFTDFDDSSTSVYTRLYRNDKRSEKLWTKPPKFTPKLPDRSILSATNINASKTSHSEKDSPRDQSKAPSLGKEELHDALEPKDTFFLGTPQDSTRMQSPVIDTTLEEDMEAIKELGRQLGGVVDDCSPTVAASSVYTTDDETPFNKQHTHGVKCPPSGKESNAYQEFSVLEEVEKQLERMEADQVQFSTTEQKSLLWETRRPTVVKMFEKALGDTDTESTVAATDAIGFFTLDQPSRNYFFAERIDRLSSPIRRRRRMSPIENGVATIGYEVEPIITPRRLRCASSITIQRSWRLHSAELQLAMSSIEHWNVSCYCQRNLNSKESEVLSRTRQQALRKAFTSVGCWWILEGIMIKENWVSIAWENDICIGEKHLRVNFECEAHLPRIALSLWGERKLAILLVRGGLRKAIRGEQAAERVARWYRRHKGKLNKNAATLQLWLRKCVKLNNDNRPNHGNGCAIVSQEPEPNRGGAGFTRIDRNTSENKTIPPLNLDGLGEGQSTAIDSTKNKLSPVERDAAIKIQSWLRLAALKSAIKEWPSTTKHLRSALKSAGESQLMKPDTFDEFEVARNILSNSLIARYHNGSQFSWMDASNIASNDDFIANRAAALAIHNIVRSYLIGLKRYREKKKVTLIQAAFRGYLARTKIELWHFSAVIIQFAWSNHMHFVVKIRNATKLQCFWRKAYCQRNYQMLLFCIVFLQAGWRRAIVSRRFAALKSAAIVLQCTWRGLRVRRSFKNFRSAIVSLQDLYVKSRRLKQYKLECCGVTTLQAWWRGTICRNRRRNYLQAIIRIQALFRCRRQLRHYHILHQNTTVVQSAWRRYRRQQLYHKMSFSAILIQSQFRGKKDRTSYFRARFALIKIQSTARRSLVAARYHDTLVSRRERLELGALTTIQRRVRGFVARKMLRKMLDSATVIQATFRMSRLRLEYKIVFLSAVKIQSFLRGYYIRNSLRSQHSASIIIQRMYRISLGKQQLEHLRWDVAIESAVKIQAQWRATAARYQFIRVRVASTMLQALFRKMSVCRHFQEKVSAAVIVQRLYRRHRMRLDQNLKLDAAISIQSFWRGSSCRSKYEGTLVQESRIRLENQAVTYTHRFWRGAIAGRSLKRLIKAVILIQRNWRGSHARNFFIKARIAAISIQALSRGRLARVKNKFEREIKALIFVQSVCRRYIVKAQLREMKNEAAKIQSIVRMASVRSKFKLKVYSIVRIQSFSRGVFVRSWQHYQHCLATKIQCRWRAVRSKQKLERLRWERAVKSSIIIQTLWRSSCEREKFRRSRIAVISLQAAFRMVLSHKHCANLFSQNQRQANQYAAIVIQSLWRGVVARRMAQIFNWQRAVKSSTLIQKHWRGSIARDMYDRTRVAAIVIQSMFRGILAFRKLSLLRSASQCSAAIEIQRSFRGHRARSLLSRSHASASCIQATWRSACSRSRFKADRLFIVTVQSLVRGSLERRHLGHCQSAARDIQRIWRGRRTFQYVEQHRFNLASASSTLIQSHWRASAARNYYGRCRVAIIIIQAVLRGTRIREQWWFVPLLVNRRIIFHSSARKIQITFALWKMDLSVWEIRSLAVLLQRGIRAQLDRSVVRYALWHLNSSIHSRVMNSFDRLIADQARGISTIFAWNRAVAHAQSFAAIVIQSAVRRLLVRNYILREFGLVFESKYANSHALSKKQKSARAIQKAFRTRLQHRILFLLKLQTIIRGWIARKTFRQLLDIRVATSRAKAATRIQSIVRGREKSMAFFVQKASAVRIQSFFRAALQRMSFLNTKSASFVVQRSYRAYLNRTKMQQYLFSAIRIQCFFRSSLSRGIVHELQQQKVLSSAVRIQYFFRRVLAYSYANKLKHEKRFSSARLIQSLWRRILAEAERKNRLSSAVYIQCYARRLLASRHVMIRKRAQQLKEELALVQLSAEARATSAITVGNLLEGQETQSGPCLMRLSHQVKTAIVETDALAKDCLPQYLYLKSPDIPLPPVTAHIQPHFLNIPASPVGTPVRCNKFFPSSNTNNKDHMPPNIDPLEFNNAVCSIDVSAKSLGLTATGSESLALEATKLLQQARDELKKVRGLPPQVSRRKVVTASPRGGDGSGTLSPKNPQFHGFGKSAETMPSPIKDEKHDWDWTSEW